MSGTTGPVPEPGAAGGPAPDVAFPGRPHADCTSDGAGGLTFSVPLPDGAQVRNAALLLRLRHGGATPDTVRLPLAPGTGGTWTAVLPGGSQLPEGRWDAYLALGDAEPRRLLPGVHDLRSLLGRTPPPGRAPVGARVPYATRYGNLTVRAWLRQTHAEAGRLGFADGVMVLHGRLYGVSVSPAARLEARPRSAPGCPGARVRTVPVLLPGVHDGETGTVFTAWLPCAALADAAVWDLWLRPGGEAGPVRVARILDDVHDKKRIFRYPPQRLTGASGTFTVRPYYTLDNDLAVRVEATEEAPG